MEAVKKGSLNYKILPDWKHRATEAAAEIFFSYEILKN